MMNMFCQLIRGYCAERRICVGHFRSRLNIGLSQKATEHNHPVNLMAIAALGILPNNYTTEDRKSGSPATSYQRRSPFQMSCVVSATGRADGPRYR